jgi:hypothetical protein
MGIDLTHVDRGWFSPRSRATPHSRRARGSQPAQALLAAQQKPPAEDRDVFTNIRAVEMLAAMAKSDRLLILNSDAPIDLDDGKNRCSDRQPGTVDCSFR